MDEELKEDLKVLAELKSFTAKKDEEERQKAMEARTKQLEWLDRVGKCFYVVISEVTRGG